MDAVVENAGSEFLTQGPRNYSFERAFADTVGANYAVAVNNGTAALHLSAAGVKSKVGEKVITTRSLPQVQLRQILWWRNSIC
ncbi:MAG: DegT/DnrJ/EryC1/StrS family aminotransferase [Cyclobacteriaceae bacterium]|nr:DegT/DnrJ/EryC1/StrS family aminotransferase [Cyclobacteriaceae bacterium]